MGQPFLKMHGLGNDFVVLDTRGSALALAPEAVRAIADRRRGVGCDQLIVIAAARAEAAARMRIFNADGGEVEACGNATRCVARLLMEETGTSATRIETPAGVLSCTRAGEAVTVDMGAPRFGWAEIPLAEQADTAALDLAMGFGELEGVKPTAVNIGNPHCVFFVADAEALDAAAMGPVLEHHPMFPERTNVEFAQILGENAIRLRVWERGVGLTRACGTGACATAVAAARTGRAARTVAVHLDGGTLEIDWTQDAHVLMTGPAAHAFRGEISEDLLRGAAP